MSQPFQSSFIPKESSNQSSFSRKSFGVMGMIATLFIVVSVLASVGLFVYIRVLESNVSSLSNQVALSEQSIDNVVIEEMFRFNERLNSVKSIVSKHQVVSNFLDLLSTNTVNEVEYIEFQYAIMPAGNVVIILEGTAKNYGSIALQENIFSNNEFIKSVKFGDLSLSQNGRVGFRLTIEAKPEITLYNPEINTSNATTTVSTGSSKNTEEDISAMVDEINDMEIPPLNI